MTGTGTDIDYDRLVADYEQGLVDRLRGFEAGDAPFLQLWVPDEDPVRSLCNILDAAATEGEGTVAIAIGADTAASLDADALRAAAADYGTVTLDADGAGYRRKTGYTAIANEHDAGPSAEWRALSDVERLQRLREAVAEIAADNGLPADEIEVAAIEIGVRVVVRFYGSLAAGDRQHHMMVLEAGIKQKVDVRLKLYQVELKDTNVIRRLSETGESR